MKLSRTIVAVAAAGWGMAWAGASPTEAAGIEPWINASSGVFDISPPPLPRDNQFGEDAGPLTIGGFPTTASSTTSTARGSASAQASGGLLPSLSVQAATLLADPGAGGSAQPGRNAANANAWLLGAYIHTGAASQQYNLNLDLSGTVSPDLTSNPLGIASLGASAVVYRTDAVLESMSIAGDEPELFLMYLAGKEAADGNVDLMPGQPTASTALQFTMSPGEKFYVYALAAASASYGVSSADGSNTFELVFDDTSNLQVVVNEAPEPAPAILLGLSLGAFGFLCRRTKGDEGAAPRT